ncbi:penicillin-binding protein activator [Aliiglaciecola lipolytica]|uniref:LppC lipoprotein n=1 Tax=Aliiglaciecola lipolytica E3 TaxID=1127673 RepID=K6YWJ2_9ALTE|nr:penicillin-binding protein activator [Aliiglaciecola lipolytica]GAC15620.1 hypothetical protein GLIP_2999 [Aliiglaciecola lipolytica E3]
MDQLKWLLVLCASALLYGCGSTPDKSERAENNVSNKQTIQEEPDLPQNPMYYLNEAQRIFAETADINQRNYWIVQAAESYKQQNACAQSEKVLHISLSEIKDPILRNQSYILLAECELTKRAIDWLKVSEYQQYIDPAVSHKNRALKISYSQQLHHNQWLNAASTLLAIEPTDNLQTTEIWYLLQRLNEQDLGNALRSHSQLAPWLQLSLIVKRFGLQQTKLQTAVNEWQTRYQDHLLSENLPQEVQLALSVKPIEMQKVAVLLPLSGRLAQQGLAIKEGLLSAYYAQQQAMSTDVVENSTVLHFFDTEINNVPKLVEDVSEYDVVIGPLIKEKLAEFSALAPAHLNIIGLNRLDISAEPEELTSLDSNEVPETSTPETTTVPGIRVYFALSPEDEAVQLANKVFNTGVVSPIVVTQQSGAPMRMANTFLQTWQMLVGEDAPAPGLATFTDNKSMRTSLTSLLDVAQSKTRIDQLENLTSEQIHSVPRNRRDIDAIVLFASPEQTELLNPIVETSLSPFNDKAVPVFASSRSYSQNFSNNSLRDLRNITFTDMPWMLPDEDHKALKNEVAKIWPKQDDTLKRLFALGFDAYSLVPDLPGLSALPQVSVKGLTGTLSIDQDGNIIRVLPFGKITESEVILLALD